MVQVLFWVGQICQGCVLVSALVFVLMVCWLVKFVDLFVCPFVCPFVCLFICLSLGLSVCPFVCVSVCSFVHSFVHLLVGRSILMVGCCCVVVWLLFIIVVVCCQCSCCCCHLFVLFLSSSLSSFNCSCSGTGGFQRQCQNGLWCLPPGHFMFGFTVTPNCVIAHLWRCQSAMENTHPGPNCLSVLCLWHHEGTQHCKFTSASLPQKVGWTLWDFAGSFSKSEAMIHSFSKHFSFCRCTEPLGTAIQVCHCDACFSRLHRKTDVHALSHLFHGNFPTI